MTPAGPSTGAVPAVTAGAVRRPPSLAVGAAGLLAATLLGATAPTVAVLLLLGEDRSGITRPGALCGLAVCWTVWWLARTAAGFAVPQVSRAVDRAARRSVLTAVARLAASGRLDPDRRTLRDAAHAAAGVAVRWEPKPGTAVAPVVLLLETTLASAGLCLALSSVSAPAGLCCAGAVVLAGAGTWRHTRDRAGFGRDQWLALARRARRRPVVARAWAVAAGLTAVLTAGGRPGLAAGPVLAGVLLYRTAIVAASVDATTLRCAVTALRRVRRLASLAGDPGSAGAAAGVRLSARRLPGGDVRVRISRPRPGGRGCVEVRLSPGSHVRLDTGDGGADVLRDLLKSARHGRGGASGDAPPLLLVPPAPLRLGFASLADNVTLGGVLAPAPQALPDVSRIAAGLRHGWRTVLSAQFSRGQELDSDGWSTVIAARVAARLRTGTELVCLAAEPDPALSRVLAAARTAGACVLQLGHSAATDEPEGT